MTPPADRAAEHTAATALQRLLLEEVPTGTVLDWHPDRYPPVTAHQAAANRAALEAALRTPRRVA